MIDELYKKIAEGAAHQSVLIEGDVEMLVTACSTASKQHAELTLYPMKSDVWTIDHSRSVATAATRTVDGSLCILIAANVFTVESQHALLKVTEEALSKIFFVIVTQNASALISTLRSRCLFMREVRAESVRGKEFLKLSLPARLTAVARAIESPEHRDVYTLISELSSLCARTVTNTEGSARLRSHLTRTNTFLSTHPIGMRQLLEHLALTAFRK